MLLTRFVKTQLVIFVVLTVLALLGLGVYFLRLPTVAGIGQYELKVDLPAAGGLYKTGPGTLVLAGNNSYGGNLPEGVSAGEALACVGLRGIGGCEFESPIEAALAALRRQVEETSEYVGLNFAAEARAMHEGRVPERSIYGEAKADEARRLVEDGIPVAPLPFVPARKTN